MSMFGPLVILFYFHPQTIFWLGCVSHTTFEIRDRGLWEAESSEMLTTMTTMMDDQCMSLFFKRRWCLETIHNEFKDQNYLFNHT